MGEDRTGVGLDSPVAWNVDVDLGESRIQIQLGLAVFELGLVQVKAGRPHDGGDVQLVQLLVVDVADGFGED